MKVNFLVVFNVFLAKELSPFFQKIAFTSWIWMTPKLTYSKLTLRFLRVQGWSMGGIQWRHRYQRTSKLRQRNGFGRSPHFCSGLRRFPKGMRMWNLSALENNQSSFWRRWKFWECDNKMFTSESHFWFWALKHSCHIPFTLEFSEVHRIFYSQFRIQWKPANVSASYLSYFSKVPFTNLLFLLNHWLLL